MWLLFACAGKPQDIKQIEKPEVYDATNNYRAKARHILITHSDAELSNKSLNQQFLVEKIIIKLM